ncbi:MAG TPA: metallophosphoesterase [Minicystis sp.]|nr:metallophosphoesterase [Minicystis sp.]
MKPRHARLLALSFAFAPLACSASRSSPSGTSGLGGSPAHAAASSGTQSGTGGAGGAVACPPCVQDSDCAAGSTCSQIAGDSYCAPDCGQGQPCAPDRACTVVTSAQGEQVSVCVPRMGICGTSTTSSSSASATTGTGASEMCGSLVGPDLSSCCHSCQSGQSCQPNGCYGGWWCNTDTCHCQQPPDPSSCTAGASSSATTGSTSSSTGSGGTGGSVGPGGGSLDTLSFAVVGDTRPPNEDDVAGYPTTVITKIWDDVEAASPRPAFAITTGDYQFSNPYGSEAATQIDLYLQARAHYANVVFPAMGNHECTGATDSNCGQGNSDGITNNYTTFLQKLLAPINQTKPYYEIDVASTSGAWTAKFVFVAANAWDSAQSSWLGGALSHATTYTFVVRHEGTTATTAPGVQPSGAIIAQHPLTMLIAGHTHTFDHYASDHELIVGNGGAPLSGGVNYGYVIARQRPSDGAIVFQEYDYSTNAVQTTISVNPDGSPAP